MCRQTRLIQALEKDPTRVEKLIAGRFAKMSDSELWAWRSGTEKEVVIRARTQIKLAIDLSSCRLKEVVCARDRSFRARC